MLCFIWTPIADKRTYHHPPTNLPSPWIGIGRMQPQFQTQEHAVSIQTFLFGEHIEYRGVNVTSVVSVVSRA